MGEAGSFNGEHLLVLSGLTPQDSWLDKIRRRFPHMEITVFARDSTKPLEETVPKGKSMLSGQQP